MGAPKQFKVPEDFIPYGKPARDPDRRIDLDEVENAFYQVSINFRKNWILSEYGCAARVSIKGVFVTPATRGANCWLVIAVDGFNHVTVFPKELVEAVCFYLQIPTYRLIAREYTLVPKKIQIKINPIHALFLKMLEKDPGLLEFDDIVNDILTQ